MSQFHVGIVAGGAGKASVIGAVATAQRNTIRLEADVVDATKVRHHSDHVRTAMARSAELLCETISIEQFRIEDMAPAFRPCTHGRDMLRPGPVTRLTTHTRNEAIEVQLVVDDGGSAVTTEAIARLIAANIATQGLLQRG